MSQNKIVVTLELTQEEFDMLYERVICSSEALEQGINEAEEDLREKIYDARREMETRPDNGNYNSI